MATRRVSSRHHWFTRDIPRTNILLIWLAFGAAVLIYSIDWHPSGWSALKKETAAKPSPRNDAAYYTGSIIIVPTRGDQCWRRMLDNRTGKMWDQGYVNCDEAVAPLEKDQRVGMSSLRMNAIGKAFNHAHDE
jgi:hypothetical protein